MTTNRIKHTHLMFSQVLSLRSPIGQWNLGTRLPSIPELAQLIVEVKRRTLSSSTEIHSCNGVQICDEVQRHLRIRDTSRVAGIRVTPIPEGLQERKPVTLSVNPRGQVHA